MGQNSISTPPYIHHPPERPGFLRGHDVTLVRHDHVLLNLRTEISNAGICRFSTKDFATKTRWPGMGPHVLDAPYGKLRICELNNDNF